MNLPQVYAQPTEPPGGQRQRSKWPLIGVAAALVIGGLYTIQAHPRLYPLPSPDNIKAADVLYRDLSGDDPATPNEDGRDLSRGEPLSDRALWTDWESDENKPAFKPLTVGGAIDYERPRTKLRLAREAQAARQAAQARAAQEAAIVAGQRAEQVKQVAARQAEDARATREQAVQDAAAAAAAKTVACNTARSQAYGSAKNVAAFLAWVRAHPCPEGTDIGDGYWNVAH